MTVVIPKTGLEFAQQVFAHLKQNESELPAHVLNNPIYKSHTAHLPPHRGIPHATSVTPR